MSRYNHRRKSFNCGDFEITKREILASISIVAVMLLIGVWISGKISECQLDAVELYNKAVKIESADLFRYGMDTNVGNAFVYGDLKAVDTVTYPEIGGEYMYIKKIKEKYTQHERTVTRKDANGKTYTETEIYWSWDFAGSEDRKCKEISFCGIVFDSNKIDIAGAKYIDTIKETRRIRYKFYGIGTEHVGTIFTNLRDKTISDCTKFYANKNIDDVVKQLTASGGEIVFWIFWIMLICGCVFRFYYLDNKWLE